MIDDAAPPNHPTPSVIELHAEGADGVARLRRQTDFLRRAAHPGVVEVRAWRDDGTSGTLVLVDPGPRRLADASPVDPARAAHLAAALASTVADLHAVGVAHGSLGANEVALDDHDRPVLLGFDAARSTVDPAAAREDVVALGRVLVGVVEALDRSAPRITRRLRGIAEQAATGEPTAREVAADCADAAAIEPSRPRALAAAAGLVLAATVVAWWNVSGTDGAASPTSAVAEGATTGSVAPLSPTTAVGSIRPEAPDGAGTQRAPHAPPIADGRPTLEHAGATFRIGSPGDRWAIGDWRCTGKVFPALLRPSTGAVFVFDDWATTTEAVTVAALAHHLGATDIVVRRGATCDDLVVTMPDGPVVVHVPGLER